jgi:hypothetical protein
VTYAGHAYGGNAYGSSAASTSSGDATVTATAIAAVVAVPAPSVQVGDSATVAASVVAATAAVPAASVGIGAAITATAVAAVAAVPTPGVTAPTDSYDAEVLADSPLLYWRLGESSGTTAADSSGNGRDGTISGSYSLGATSLVNVDNTAVDFTDAVVQDAYDTALNLSTATYEAWFKADTFSGVIIRRGVALAGAIGAQIVASSDPMVKFEFTTPGGDVYVVEHSTGWSTGTTYHVALTFDGTTLRAYVNATEVGSSATPAGSSSVSNPILMVGATETTAQNFDGVIDEVAIYGTALSAARIEAHYDAGALSFPITPAAVAATVAVPAPTVASSSQANVNATVVAAVASVPSAFVGDDNALINAAVIAATVAIPAPGITTAIQIGTETRDPSVGGRLRLSGYVTVEAVPAVPTPTTTKRVLKRVSQTYPDPTLTDGRPG